MASEVTYKKGYVDGPYGQLHYHSACPVSGPGDKTPLVMFHQNPKSSFEYRHLIREMGNDRLVVAIDTPGYGESDDPPNPLTMPEVTAALVGGAQSVLTEKGLSGPVDVFGFHTGALIAADAANAEPDFVRRVILSGIPYHDDAYADEFLASLEFDFELTEDGAFIKERWDIIVGQRAEGVSVIEAAKSFLEDIRSLNKSQYAYVAAFGYRPVRELPRIQQPILIVLPHEMLKDQTLQAHREAIPQADLVDMPTIIDDVFDTGWQEFADAMRPWLDKEF